MRKIAVLMVLAVVMAFVAAGLAVAAAQPDKIDIGEIQKMKGPVPFDHKKHVGLAKECKECHHADQPGQEQKCFACHTDKADAKKPSMKDAFHKQCKDCHAKKSAPTKCNDCHKGK